jgi:hypothetical protein
MALDLIVLAFVPFFAALLAISAARRVLEGPLDAASRFETAGLVFLWCTALSIFKLVMSALREYEPLAVLNRDWVFFAGIVVMYGVLVECLCRACRLPYGRAAYHAFLVVGVYFASRLIAIRILLAR